MQRRRSKTNMNVVKGGFISVRHDDPLGASYSTFRMGSPEWATWIANATSFRYEWHDYSFTARNETRRGKSGYWYAYRTFKGKTYKKYIGDAETITHNKLYFIGKFIAELITQQKGFR